MTEFHPDCTINLHVDWKGKPARGAWSCSVVHHRKGRILIASRYLGELPRVELEAAALSFGLRQVKRLLQEKVVLRASFRLDTPMLEQKPFGQIPELHALWTGFRLRRVVPGLDPREAELLQKQVSGSFRRKPFTG